MADPLPETPSAVPQRWHGVGAALGRLTLRLLGFGVVGALPDAGKVLIVAAPHTSNWDFVVAIATMLALRLEIGWLGKHTLFRWPFGALMRFLGGVPVNRSQAQGVIEAAVAAFHGAERVWIAIAPEGTRKRVDKWKSGFHRIATGAGVPIFPVALDYSSRVVRLLPLYQPVGELEKDVAALQALFRPEMARYPDRFWGA